LAIMSEPVIQLEGVAIAFGERRVLDGLDLTIARGETTVIVGRSGSGKTVLLKLMLGLLTPDRGRVRVFGRDLAAASQRELIEIRKRMGMLFQNYALFDGMSVEANVEFPLVETAGVPHRDAERRAHEIIELLGLHGSEHVLPGELSGGMRKRASLARALVARPEVVLFDEPTTGLDPIMVERVDEMIVRAKGRYGITSVIISHDVASIRRLADRVAFLHDGRIIFSGSFDDFMHSELPPIRSFLATAEAPEDDLTSPTEQPVIELVGVHKWFGDKHVLRGVDLAIYPNRITTLIGASGSGKSVMAKHMMGLVRPDRGVVRVFGQDLATLDERELEQMRARFGLVFQHSALLDWLDVHDNIAFPLVERRQLATTEITARVDEIVERLGLGGMRSRMPAELSAGERKRVALARAMVMRPSILIYDEPTSGQDPPRTREIDEMILQAQRELGITSIVISHDMAATFRIADTIAFLHEGKIAACGSPAELRASHDPFVDRFLEAAALT
jgi:ABC-type transporter Mla maintaining outer membrane lipid asymmetry ATPase subunit MlaF